MYDMTSLGCAVLCSQIVDLASGGDAWVQTTDWLL